MLAAVSVASLHFFGGAGDIDPVDPEWRSDSPRAAIKRRDGHLDPDGPQGREPGSWSSRAGLRPAESRQGRTANAASRDPRLRSAPVIGGGLPEPRDTIGRSTGERARGDRERSAGTLATESDPVDRGGGREPADRSALPADGADSASPAGDRDDVVDAEREEEDGTLFDPLAAEAHGAEVDRGDGEDPLAVKKVDFLQDGAIYVGDESVYTFPAAGNIRGAEGAIDMVIVPEWSGADGSDHSLLYVGAAGEWKSRMWIVKNGESIRFMTFDDDGIERSLNVRIPDWQVGERHEITASWDEEEIRLFLDGQLAGARPLDGQITFHGRSMIELGTPGGTQGPSATYEELSVSSEPAYATE